jgi:LAO/AO transport system kinase
VGVTGPPGAGKSTLVSALTAYWRKSGKRVGVLAVDPSSPFTGGALLGDRVRMTQHLGDAGVFVRSLATRGASGGLAAATEDAADLLDAAGFDPVVLETVGVGQAELDVAHAADTVVVVLAPGSGDEVQAMKAGLLEVADVVVVNQADHPGADRLEAALKAAFELRTGLPTPPLFATVATTGQGVEAVGAAVDARAAQGGERLAQRRLERARRRVVQEVERGLTRNWWRGREEDLDAAALAVAAGLETARDAAARLTSREPGSKEGA